MDSNEKARRLRMVYALLCKLAEESTTPASETLPGDGAGVGVEAATKRQDHLSQGCPEGQRGGKER